MIVRQKILIFLILTMLCSIAPPALADNWEEPDVETGVKLVPLEMEQTSEDYVDSCFMAELANQDENEQTMENVIYTIVLTYNVTYEILNVTKDQFDDARIVNATAIEFEASEIIYGANRTGSAWVRLFSPGGVHVKVTVEIESNVGEKTYKIKAEAEADASWEEIGQAITKFWTWIKSIIKGKTESGASVPEFPAGELIALGMGLLIVFVFRSKNLKSSRRRKNLNTTCKRSDV